MSSEIWLIGAALLTGPPTAHETPIEVESVLITLSEQVDVPARELAVLTQLAVNEGDLVQEGDLLAQLDDRQVQLQREQARVDLEIARAKAENDVNVRFAKKSYEVAQAELQRALDALARYAKSVSQTELDRLRLSAERARLQIEQSQHEREVARLTARSKEAALALAELAVERRRIAAPLTGVVAEVHKHRGEWAAPGDAVLRLLRMDRLRAEWFLPAAEASPALAGRPVTLRVDPPGRPKREFPGTLVYVSSEIDPFNGQIRVWAEIENIDLLLRPGLKGSLTIEPPAQDTSAE